MPAIRPAPDAGTTLTAPQIAGWARTVWSDPEQQKIAVAIALALPANGHTTATRKEVNGSTSYGVWQINDKTDRALFDKHEQWWSVQNAAMAADVQARRGWGAWGVYSVGAYRLYLPRAAQAVANPEGGTGKADTEGPIERAVEGVVDPVADVADAVKGIAQVGWKAGAWMGRRENWIRVAQVATGAALIVAGLVVVAKPVVTGTISEVKGAVT